MNTIVVGMFGLPGGAELIIVAFVILLLFGNRLPSVMRSLGQGIVEFKKGVKGVEEEIDDIKKGVEEETKNAGKLEDADKPD